MVNMLQIIINKEKREEMFKRLFMSNQIDKALEECAIDTTHEMVHTKQIIELAQKYLNPTNQRQNIHINININHNIGNEINININNNHHSEPQLTKQQKNKKNQFLESYVKKLRTSNHTQKIKALVVGHAIAKKVADPEFYEMMEKELQKNIGIVNPEQKSKTMKGQIEIKVENTKEDFMQMSVISFYCFYLKKLLINMDTFTFARECQKMNNLIQAINHGFVVLNLVNYILRSQQTFNKMGRYYLNYKELLSLFIKYLEDLLVYNTFIKKLTNISLHNIKDAGSEELRHHFLFLTEAQKTSDRLYEFFYNRYYYGQVKNIIMMPTFLHIHSQEYRDLLHHVKKRDKELVVLVKKSKYEIGNGRSQSCTSRTDRTEQNDRSSMTNHTEGASFYSMNQTMTELPPDISLNQSITQTSQRKRYRSAYRRS